MQTHQGRPTLSRAVFSLVALQGPLTAVGSLAGDCVLLKGLPVPELTSGVCLEAEVDRV